MLGCYLFFETLTFCFSPQRLSTETNQQRSTSHHSKTTCASSDYSLSSLVPFPSHLHETTNSVFHKNRLKISERSVANCSNIKGLHWKKRVNGYCMKLTFVYLIDLITPIWIITSVGFFGI